LPRKKEIPVVPLEIFLVGFLAKRKINIGFLWFLYGIVSPK